MTRYSTANPNSTASILKRTIVMCGCAVAAFGALVLPGRSEQGVNAQDKRSSDAIATTFASDVQPLIKKYCFECHSGDRTEAEIDLAAFATIGDARKHTKTWLRVREMLDSGQMPPKDSLQPSDDEWTRMKAWVGEFLTHEAKARAGDPGPVILRRLNNDEYNYTVRDLTGVETLNPTREFPVDGAAGEGFTNAGSAQSMSPSLVQKYLDAAKEVADHAVLLPDGITFSPYTTRRDHSDELVGRIQAFYRQFTADGGGQAVNLQGIRFDTNQGGVLPLEPYLVATLEERDALAAGTTTIDAVALERRLNAKYLGTLWSALTTEGNGPSLLLDPLREQWRVAKAGDAPKLAAAVDAHRKVLWKFNPIGHIGREGRPKVWMEPVSPVVVRRDFNVKVPDASDGDVSVFLTVSDAGDGKEHDYVVWENPRLVTENSPDIALRDIAGLQKRIEQVQNEALSKTTVYLAAASEAAAAGDDFSEQQVAELAKRHGLDVAALKAWLDYLAIGESGPVIVSGHFTNTEIHGNYNFVRSWGTGATPIVTANSSDQQVRIPGISRPHGITAHPSPTLFVAIGWQSPFTGLVQIEAQLSDAHPECGNGQEWFLQHRTNRKVGTLWQGDFPTGGSATMPAAKISVRQGDLVSFILGPRHGSHACDLTEMNFTITELNGDKRVWDLAKDISPDILAGNPHSDRLGHEKVWHFYKGEMTSVNRKGGRLVSVPPESLLGRWQQERDDSRRSSLARQVQTLATGKSPADANSPDGVLYEQLRNLAMSPVNLESLLADVEGDDRFGRHPLGDEAKSSDLIVQAPSVVEFRIPAKLARGRSLVASGRLDAQAGREGSVKLEAALQRIEPSAVGAESPFVVNEGSLTRQQVDASLSEFHNLFPPNLCYARIVPVDEVVTLTLYYRQDDALQRLMLNDEQVGQLDRLWDRLFYVAHEPTRYEVAFEQIRAFATQDRPDLVKTWAPLVEGVTKRAADFRQRLIDTRPAHVQAVIDFANRAWRRPLTTDEQAGIRDLYRQLRGAEIPHDESIRLTLARVLTSPAFLYRREQPGDGQDAAPVSDIELAGRLSYFLWSSAPDEELRRIAAAGKLSDDEVLKSQTARMLSDPRTRRLTIQFACQWLHLRGFDQNDDKNEKLYPEFASLRADMYEETVRFFEDMFRNDRSILDLLDADHTFVNEALAKHYGIQGVTGPEWRRVDGVRTGGRGGLLGMATLLASQSGASRTSPILRGNWVYETLLGERLPKPPANVPQLPETVPSGLTARQLIEQHSSVAECAKCHARIDPYGFALEQYDAIGRLRSGAVDTKTTLDDGTVINGINGLRDYLLNQRREDVVRQFCRKLLGFALGREVQLSDEMLLDEMQQRLTVGDYRFSTAVQAIVASRQFREIRGRSSSYNE